jgi:hypothetical protein
MADSIPLSLPRRRGFRCTTCGCPLGSTTGDDRGLRCPIHGYPLAQISGHKLWEGQEVRIVRPARRPGSWVVRFPPGHYRTLRYDHLIQTTMEQR